jgi:hypothetical protein
MLLEQFFLHHHRHHHQLDVWQLVEEELIARQVSIATMARLFAVVCQH